MSASSAAPGRTDRNLADLVSEAARQDHGHVALIESVDGRELSWQQLDTAVDREAARLLEHGLQSGQRVGLRLAASVAFCVSLFGIMRAGGVAIPLSPGAPARELDRILAAGTPSLLIAAVDDPTADESARRAGATRLDPPASEPVPSGPVCSNRSVSDTVSSPPAPTGGADLAVLAFTSGTTGVPRGVMLSHQALLANLEQCAAVRPPPMTAADRVLLALPLFHSYGLGPGLLQVANSAATGVLAQRFHAEETLETVRRYRVTVVVGVPPMYRAWLQLPPQRLAECLRTVRLFTSGAAALEPSVPAEMRAATGLDVFEGYGLTETGPVLTTTMVAGVAKPGSVGRPLPGVPDRGVGPVELRLVDARGSPLPTEDDEDAGGTGVVAVRGPNLFSGYWPDGAFGPAELPGLGPGWFCTGDVGYLDADGDLYLVDRVDDLIIVNGFNVYPREVEDVLLEHPAVHEAAAIGMPNEQTGQAVHAVLVPVEGAQPTPAEILKHCARRLARFKVPVAVTLVGSLPHLPTGKLARRIIREGLVREGLDTVPEPSRQPQPR